MKVLLLLLLSIGSLMVAAQSEKIEQLTQEGIALHDRGDYAGAIEKYKHVLRYDPSSDLMNYEIAFSYQQSKNYRKAIEHCDIVINGKGQSQILAVALKGTCLDESGQAKEADAYYKKVLKQYPSQYILLCNYGIRCSKMNLQEEGEESFLKALELKPDHAASHLGLAVLKLNTGDKLKGILGLYFFLMLENSTPRATEALTTLMNNLDIPQDGKSDSTKFNLNISFPASHEKLSRTDLGEVSLFLITTMNAELAKNKSPWEKLSYDTEKIFLILGELQSQGEKRIEDYWWGFYIPFYFSVNTAGHTEAFTYKIAGASKNPDVENWKKNNKEKIEAFEAWMKKQ